MRKTSSIPLMTLPPAVCRSNGDFVDGYETGSLRFCRENEMLLSTFPFTPIPLQAPCVVVLLEAVASKSTESELRDSAYECHLLADFTGFNLEGMRQPFACLQDRNLEPITRYPRLGRMDVSRSARSINDKCNSVDPTNITASRRFVVCGWRVEAKN